MRHWSPRLREERGAVLAHVSIVLAALIAFSALAIDYGVQYVSRNEIQNAADAGALAAAADRFMPHDTVLGAQNAAIAAVQANPVWGAASDITVGDVNFESCPPGAPGVPDTCVRVEAFRTSYQGRQNPSPLPTFFAQMVNVSNQGVRASATAQLRAAAGTADCVKPWGLPDRWVEQRNPTNEYNRYRLNGGNRGQLLPGTVDYYDPNQGYSLPNDYGRLVQLYIGGNGNQALSPGFFQPVVVDPGNVGASRYQDAIEGCVTTPITPGMVLQPEPGRMVGPTTHGFENLIALDPAARWDPAANNGMGGPVGGCMAAGTCSRSPRWVAVPVFDIDQYEQARLAQNPAAGRNLQITVVKIIGVWIDEVRNANNDIRGYITHYPTVNMTGNAPNGNTGAFARTVILVR